MKAIRTGKHNNPVRTARNPTRTAQNLAGAARNPTGNSTGSGREQHGMWPGKHAISLMRGTTAQRRRITTFPPGNSSAPQNNDIAAGEQLSAAE